MSKMFVAIAIGMFAFGLFASHSISTAPNANATVKTMSKVNQVVPFDLMAKSRNLPVEASAAF
jgi:hypothetical protein